MLRKGKEVKRGREINREHACGRSLRRKGKGRELTEERAKEGKLGGGKDFVQIKKMLGSYKPQGTNLCRNSTNLDLGGWYKCCTKTENKQFYWYPVRGYHGLH